MTIGMALNWARSYFLDVKSNFSVSLESEILLSHVLGVERTFLHARHQENLSEESFKSFQDLVFLRSRDVPLAYLIGWASFYSRYFYVNKSVLIPRPETELLIDELEFCLRNFSNFPVTNIAEIGTGSGVIAIMLAIKYPNSKIVATDICEDALEVARKNIRFTCFCQTHGILLESFIDAAQIDFEKHPLDFHLCNGFCSHIELIHTSFLDGVEGDFDLLISNPPYISPEYPLQPEVLMEPHSALFSGKEGFETLCQVIHLAAKRKIRFLACEMGFNQKKLAKEILQSLGYRYKFYKDYAGYDRGFVAYMD